MGCRTLRRATTRAARRRRCVPGRVYHVSSRTLFGEYTQQLMAQSPDHAALFWGAVGRAALRYRVDLIAGVALSNHFHLVVRPWTATGLSQLMQYVKARTAELVNLLGRRRGAVWTAGFASTALLDDAAEAIIFRYVTAHGTKDGLVARPEAWAGPQLIDALRTGAPVRALILDFDAFRAARRRDPRCPIGPYTSAFSVRLAPLTAFVGRSAAYRAWCNTQIDDLIDAHAHRQFLGMPAVLAKGWQHRPETLKYSAPKPFMAAGPDRARLIAEATAAHRAGVEASCAAIAALVENGRRAAAAQQPEGYQWTPFVAHALCDAVGLGPLLRARAGHPPRAAA